MPSWDTKPGKWRLTKYNDGDLQRMSKSFTDATGMRVTAVIKHVYGSEKWQMAVYEAGKSGDYVIRPRYVPSSLEGAKFIDLYITHHTA